MAAIKKNRIYSSLWESCDNLRGGLDASEYKDYILTLLFMKYITDKYLNKGKYEDFKSFMKLIEKLEQHHIQAIIFSRPLALKIKYKQYQM